MPLQLWRGLLPLATILECVAANPLFSRSLQRNMTTDSIAFGQSGVRNVKRMAAIGDSYSAGIGAGDRLGGVYQAFDAQSDWWCSRYNHAFPYLINNDRSLGDPGSRTFQFKSCSGAKTKDVLEKQIPNIDSNQEVILLSIGGNDVELVNILNQCIYQWATVSKFQATLAQLDLENHFSKLGKNLKWDEWSRGCDGQLDYSEGIIGGSDFSRNLDTVISQAKAKLASSGTIYYTGYAKFFADDTPECDNVSWSTWIYKAYANFLGDQHLTGEHRVRMNRLVDQVNQKIEAAVGRAGGNVKFVNYDPWVGRNNGRFCEAGVDEATKESNTRPGLMFYELDMGDRMGSNINKRSDDQSPDESFEGSINQFAEIALLLDPGATMKGPGTATANIRVSMAAQDDPISKVAGFIGKFLPDGWGRVFHPTQFLHELIAQLIIWEMTEYDTYAGADTCQIGSMSPPPPAGAINEDAKGQQIALASYINPLSGKEWWTEMIDYPSDKVSVLVANVLNGPDSTPKQEWTGVIKRAAAKKKTIIGYVRTGYLGVSQQKFTTMLGSTDLADWIAQIETDVELWYSLYGEGNIGGIFLDEGWNKCGPNNLYADVYRLISDNIKQKHPGAYVVLNPGDYMPQCFEESADTLLTFESEYNRYIDTTNDTYKTNGWTAKDSRKIWHIIHTAPEDKVREIVKLAQDRGAGMIQVTNAVMPNPYNVLPSKQFMKTFIDAVESGKPRIEHPHPPPGGGGTPAPPGSLTVVKADYSSVKLSWAASTGADAIAIYRAGKEVVRLPGHMQQTTVGNLNPGESGHEFKARAIGRDGTESDFSDPATADTMALPNGKPIINIKVAPSAAETIFEADVLIPFAFVRIFVTARSDSCPKPSYPINTDNGKVCALYMIENKTGYKYSGVKDQKTGFWTWAWTPTAKLDNDGNNMRVDRDVYHYTWHFPIGTSTVDTSNIIVQGEGFNKRTDVFLPCPFNWKSGSGVKKNENTKELMYCEGKGLDYAPFDCKGETLCSTTLLKWCDEAVNSGKRDNRIYKANGESLAVSGNCRSNWEQFGCKVYIQGKDTNGNDCKITGNDMWWAYQDIREMGGWCPTVCGSKHLGNGCTVSIDYYYGCDNRDSGPRRR